MKQFIIEILKGVFKDEFDKVKQLKTAFDWLWIMVFVSTSFSIMNFGLLLIIIFNIV